MKEYVSLQQAIEDVCGSGRKIVSKRYVAGGDINEACMLSLDDGAILFMKSNSLSSLDNFRAEAQGLEAIRKTRTIRVPEILGVGTNAGVSFLLMESISGATRVKDYWETFAAELEAMHQSEVGSFFGFANDNWIGYRRQINTKNTSWISFYRDCRLHPQFEAAKEYFSISDRQKIERLLSHLDRFLIEPEKPSLVHGDLWSGNMITGNDGKVWLIDPAVYYGHPEVDIAMTELFGGFSGRFYEAYKEAGRMEPGYTDRRDLYNLYQLLNHLNMFGGGYFSSVMRIVNRYA